MNLDNFITVFNPQLSSKMVGYAVRPTTIWTIWSDSSICVFKRSNPKIYNKFPFDGLDPYSAKISVDDLGEKCVIYWDRLPILFFSLATGVVTTVPNITSSFHPTAACWISIPGEPPAILMGSLVGEILMISSSENHESTYLYIFPETQTIREMYAYCEDDLKMVFLLIQEQVYTFISNQPLQLIFEKGPSNKVLILGETSENVIIDHRLSLDTLDGNLRLSALHQLGIISFKAYKRPNGTIDFEQTITEYSIANTVTFQVCQWGILLAFEKNILLMYNSKPKASLHINGVKFMHFDNKGLVLFAVDEIKTIPIRDLRRYLVYTAVNHKDFNYALFVAQNDPIKSYVLKKQIDSKPLSEVGSYIYSLKWPLNDVTQALGLNSKPTLFYLCEMIKHIPKEKKKHRKALVNLALHLYTSFYPDLEEEFLTFIEDNYEDLDQHIIYKRLSEISFTKGIIKYATIIDDPNTILNNMFLESSLNKNEEENKDKQENQNPFPQEEENNQNQEQIDNKNNSNKEIFQYLSELKNHNNIITETLIRLLKTNFHEVEQFLLNHKLKLKNAESLPVLIHTPAIAHYLISDFTKDPTSLSLLVVSLCMSKLNDRLIQLCMNMWTNLDFLFRFSSSFQCDAASARILIKMNQPKLAVRFGMKVGLDYCNNLLTLIRDPIIKKKAWIEFLHDISTEEKEKALTRVMSAHILTFEEIIDIISDDSFLFEYSDEMLSAVTELEKDAETTHYVTKFQNVRAPDFPIGYEESCCFCQFPLLGTKFTAFPCGHKMHRNCLDQMIEKMRIEHPEQAHFDPLDSCPFCGMFSVETSSQSFN